MTDGGGGGNGADAGVGGDSGGDALAIGVAAVCVCGSRLTEGDRRKVTEPTELMEVSEVTAVETLWPLALPSSVSVEADRRNVSNGGEGDAGADGDVGGDSGAGALATGVAAVCVGGSRLTGG